MEYANGQIPRVAVSIVGSVAGNLLSAPQTTSSAVFCVLGKEQLTVSNSDLAWGTTVARYQAQLGSHARQKWSGILVTSNEVRAGLEYRVLTCTPFDTDQMVKVLSCPLGRKTSWCEKSYTPTPASVSGRRTENTPAIDTYSQTQLLQNAKEPPGNKCTEYLIH